MLRYCKCPYLIWCSNTELISIQCNWSRPSSSVTKPRRTLWKLCRWHYVDVLFILFQWWREAVKPLFLMSLFYQGIIVLTHINTHSNFNKHWSYRYCCLYKAYKCFSCSNIYSNVAAKLQRVSTQLIVDHLIIGESKKKKRNKSAAVVSLKSDPADPAVKGGLKDWVK